MEKGVHMHKWRGVFKCCGVYEQEDGPLFVGRLLSCRTQGKSTTLWLIPNPQQIA